MLFNIGAAKVDPELKIPAKIKTKITATRLFSAQSGNNSPTAVIPKSRISGLCFGILLSASQPISGDETVNAIIIAPYIIPIPKEENPKFA